MQLRTEDVQKLEAFLGKLRADVYPEPTSDLHTRITGQMWERCQRHFQLYQGARVLDIGCGQGVALRLFRDAGLQAIGITLGDEDLRTCREQGFDVYEMDQSFLDFPDACFDLVWCRHCLEHSVFPFFTLSEMCRVLRTGAYLYVEVPAPDTSCCHQTNRNHYSVMGKSMWADLMRRSGMTILEVIDIDITVQAGPDCYWAFILLKTS